MNTLPVTNATLPDVSAAISRRTYAIIGILTALFVATVLFATKSDVFFAHESICCAILLGAALAFGCAIALIVYRFDQRRLRDLSTIKEINAVLEMTNQQLQSSNQQFRAGEQQLTAANQQLHAQQQQLRAAHQQLLAHEQQLKAAVTQLAMEKERAQTYLDIAGTLFVAIDLNGTVTLINKKGCEILGYSREEVVGKNWFEHFLPERIKDPVIPVSKKLLAGEIEPAEYWENPVLTKSGEERLIAWHSNFLYDESGKIIGHISSGSDVTDRRKAEVEREKIQRLESLGFLAGGIAHDFNNLLSGIFGYIDMALEYEAPGSVGADYLGKAIGAFTRAKQLSQQLLTFSKGGAPVKKPVLINNVVRDAAQLALSGSSIRCDLSLQQEGASAEVDEGQISQAINNVMLNARQAMPEGGVIEVKTERISIAPGNSSPLAPGDYVKISIKDAGVGIPREHLAKIFDPFFTTKQTGSGLGLATTFSIVRKHGGHIEAESKLGRGSLFTMYLPALDTEAPPAEYGRKKIIAGSGRILVMDDEKVIRDMVFSLLTRQGYEVETAVNGEEALEKYKAAMDEGRKFNAVLLDLTISGGMGGQQTISRLLEIDPAVNGIVSSGYSDSPVISRYHEFGFKGAVSKPYMISELTETLRNVLTKAEQPPQS